MIGFAKFLQESTPEQASTDMTGIADGLIRILNKKTGKNFRFAAGQNFKNGFGRLTGRLYADGISAVRINFMKNKLHSVSRWVKYGKMPDLTVLIKKQGNLSRSNILSMTDKIFDPVAELEKFFGTTRIETPDGEIAASITMCVILMHREGYSIDAIKQYLDNVVDDDYIYGCVGKNAKFGNKELNDDVEPVEELTVSTYDNEDVEVAGEIPETVEDNPGTKENEEELASQLIADPLPVFRQLNTYVLMVARGLSNALLITGQGGIGKSYNVNKILSAYGTKNKDYVIMKGKSSTSAMYKFLYDNYDKIVVFDDCDSVLQDADGLNILKGVLDSGRVKEVSWNTSGSQMVNTFGCETHEEIEERLQQWSETHKGREGIPTYFQFQGACIFISNLFKEDMEKSPAMQPLLTRCTAVDIKLMAEDIIFKIESILPHIKIYDNHGKDITNEELKQEVFEFMKSDAFMKDPRLKGKEKSLSIRLYEKMYLFRFAGLPNWKELSFCL